MAGSSFRMTPKKCVLAVLPNHKTQGYCFRHILTGANTNPLGRNLPKSGNSLKSHVTRCLWARRRLAMKPRYTDDVTQTLLCAVSNETLTNRQR